MAERITISQFHAAEGAGEWRILGDGAYTFFETGTFARGAALVQAIAAIPGLTPHQPDVDLRHDGVTVRLISIADDYYGMTTRDVELARQISAAAHELGLHGDPFAVQTTTIVPGAVLPAAVMPFWRAILGYELRADNPTEDLIDPRHRNPSFWLERMEQPRADGNGSIHVAVWVPIEKAQARVDAALAAGGHIVRDDFAPAWWTLADRFGNEADVATAEHRD